MYSPCYSNDTSHPNVLSACHVLSVCEQKKQQQPLARGESLCKATQQGVITLLLWTHAGVSGECQQGDQDGVWSQETAGKSW